VTMVVPAYNSSATIGPCLESLLAQDYPSGRYEIIVVDNNSSDNTSSVVREYPVSLAFEKGIQTPGAARNRGIALAETEILAFMDSDCIAEKDWLRNLIQPFFDPAVGVAGGRIASQAPDSSLVEAFLAQVKVFSEERFHPSEPKGFPTGNVAYRRIALDQVGKFDAAMRGGEDVDLAWRVQAYGGYLGIYVLDAVVYHKHRSTLADLFYQYRGYGFTEMVLTTLYRGQAFHQRTPIYQLRAMVRQVRALGTYCLFFPLRLTRWRRWRSDRMYLAWLPLWFVLDSGYLVGKVHGLVRTRFFRRNPYHTNHQEVRRTPLATSAPLYVPSLAGEISSHGGCK
jgi:cellulose synthase/poly-beta-1,6-N-acetylglucosamine synthase-like glycosyltransferase